MESGVCKSVHWDLEKEFTFQCFYCGFCLVKLGATLQPEPKLAWDFSSGPVVKTSPSSAEGKGSIPGRGTKIPRAVHRGRNIEEKEKKKKPFSDHWR